MCQKKNKKNACRHQIEQGCACSSLFGMYSCNADLGTCYTDPKGTKSKADCTVVTFHKPFGVVGRCSCGAVECFSWRG